MASKNLVLILNLHCPYIKVGLNDASAYEAESAQVYQQISNLYLPVLDFLSFLKQEKLDAKIGLVFSASACEILSDPDLKKKYNKWLDNLIEFASKEAERTKKDSSTNKTSAANLETARENKRKFNELWNCDLLKAFATFAEEGWAEILSTCGTYLFMPHYADMTEILNAQVESGLMAIKRHFGSASDGFYLPEMGYAQGVENVIKPYGFSYTLLPSQSFLFSEIPPANGTFMPARCQNGLSIFAADELNKDTFESGVYRDLSTDLAWELSAKELSPFIKEGHPRARTFWSYKNRDGGHYSCKEALEQAKTDAEQFAQEKAAVLKKAQIFLGDDADVSVCLAVNALDISVSWPEFFDWLKFFARACCEQGLKLSAPNDLLEGNFHAQKISPYPAAFSEFSYGEDLLSNKNSWLTRYLRKACERIVDLVSRFPGDGGLKTRLLNLGARELLLVQDCEFSKMVGRDDRVDYVSEFFKRGIVAFSNIYDALGSNTVSTEWFCALEKLHPVMPWLNYRIFAKKK